MVITFETSKILKEKGYKKPTLHYYFEDGVLVENKYRDTIGMDYGSMFGIEYSELTENWNDGYLTTKDGRRCYGCNKSVEYLETFSAPMQSELQKWLRDNHNIHIQVYVMDKWLDNGNEMSVFFEVNLKSLNKLNGLTNIKANMLEFNTYESALEQGLIEALKLI